MNISQIRLIVEKSKKKARFRNFRHLATFIHCQGGGFQDELFRFVNFLGIIEHVQKTHESVKFEPIFTVNDSFSIFSADSIRQK